MKDMDSFDDALTIMTNYMSIKQIILLFCGIALVVALFIFLFIKGPKVKDKISIKKNIVVIILITLVTDGLLKRFGPKVAVDNLSLQIPQGHPQ